MTEGAPVGLGALNHQLLEPVGPKAAEFGASRAFIVGIMGPVGGGKTTECIAKCLRAATLQNAVWDPARGCHVKRARGLVIRDTYPNLDRTVIKSWHRWFPKHLGRWSGEAPRTHSFTIDVGRRGRRDFYQLELEMIFSAIGEHSIEDVLRGLEITFAWPNEWDRLPKNVLELLVGRVGRFPGASEGGCAFAQIFGDFNAPDEDNHLYDLFENNDIDPELAEAIRLETGGKQPLLHFVTQPGGLEPDAENLHNLPGASPENPKGGRSYYVKQAALMAPDMKRRMIDNKWGAVRDGMPVYPEFSSERHVVADPKPIHGLPLRIGMDAGLTPAAVIAQRTSFGQTIVLAELATFLEEDDQLASVGPTMFGEALADLLAARFQGFPVEYVAVDPAAARGTDGSGNELTWLQTAARASKLHIRPAPVPNNDLTVRLEAVRRPLTRTVEGGRPALLISSSCKILKRGFNSGYKYRRTKLAGGDGRYENKPHKNQYSHVHDALQYLLVASGEGRILGVNSDRHLPPGHGLDRSGAPRVTVEADYDPFG